ncbi:MAG: nucleotidyl transferase AbiEii/AbiGii toxin family protein [Deltaproteobacteria bacterium]|nr:nucleotidyl transferase AbiEii/AbiGii toxin family protein [Deltaproteobacteria bacterium]
MSEGQREVLLQLVTEPTIEEQFFLTGGTALSVFYLHHRMSNDLDLFSSQQVNLSELGFWIKGMWPGEIVTLKESPHFFSCLIRETKLDLVIDPLSVDEQRPSVTFENGHKVRVDTIRNIVSNKLCACVSRTEPKDYVDLYAIFKKMPEIKFETVYAMAKKKDAIFDDPPTAAFQLEEGIAFIKETPEMIPPLRTAFDYDDFLAFCEHLTMWIYERLSP